MILLPNKKFIIMKKIILLLLAVTWVILLSAQGKSSPVYTITVSEAYEKILVGENIKVILTEDLPGTVSTTWKNEIQLTVTDKVLSVKKLVYSNPGKVTVYIPVQRLKSIELNEGSSAYSNGQLLSSKLTVYVKESSYFELRSKGIIKVVSVPRRT